MADLTDEQRAAIRAKLRQAFASALKAAATYRAPPADSFGFHIFGALDIAVRIAELDAQAEAEEQRRMLRAKFGPLARLTPDWWTVRRFERRFVQALAA
jgi:hypothetical protein